MNPRLAPSPLLPPFLLPGLLVPSPSSQHNIHDVSFISSTSKHHHFPRFPPISVPPIQSPPQCAPSGCPPARSIPLAYTTPQWQVAENAGNSIRCDCENIKVIKNFCWADSPNSGRSGGAPCPSSPPSWAAAVKEKGAS